MHPLKALRKTSVQVLADAGITVEVAGMPVPVTIIEHPPTGGAVPEEDLPALYCYVRSERIEPDSMQTDGRSVLLDFVLQASGIQHAALDQVDDMQLALERTIAASNNLGGLVMTIRPVGSEVNVERGEVVFAARRVTFEARILAARSDPSVAT